jgi:hypothetical protein
VGWGGLRRCHMSCGPRPSPLLGWAPVLTCVLWLQKLPPSWGGLRRCHMSCGPRPYLPAGVGSGAAMCPMAPYPASLLGWAPVPPRVLWPRPCLPVGVGSGTTMCPAAPNPASLLGWALVPPCVLRPQTLLPSWGGLRRHHVSTVATGRGPQE